MKTFGKAGDVLSLLFPDGAKHSLILRFFFLTVLVRSRWIPVRAMLEHLGLGYSAWGRAFKLNHQHAQPTRAQSTALVWKSGEGWEATQPHALSHTLEPQMAPKHTLKLNISNAYILCCCLSCIM